MYARTVSNATAIVDQVNAIALPIKAPFAANNQSKEADIRQNKEIERERLMDKTKILLIDSHELSREGLKLLLHGDSCDIIGATRSLDEASAAIAEGLRPNLVLFALKHLGESAATLQQIRAGFSAFKFVVITAAGSPSLSARCIEAGVNGCLLADMSTNALTQSLRLIMLGQEIFPATAGVLPIEATSHAPRELGPDSALPGSSRSLSEREVEILGKLLLGRSNKTIAREIGCEDATVKVHLKGLLRKLHASNRTQLAIWAFKNCYGERMPA
jgi:two-component system nitrate/nitrite response regulator NarL